MKKKKGSALLLSLFILTLVSMFLLGSFQRVKSRDIDLSDNVEISNERNTRDNGIRILKYELKKLKEIRNDSGIYFKSGSNVQNKPSSIDINKPNYLLNKNINPLKIKPKPNQYYSGIEINGNYDYIGKTLNTKLSKDDYAFKINSLYLRNGNLLDKILPGTDVSEYHTSSWARKENSSRVKIIGTESLLKEVKTNQTNKKRSFSGYKVEKIELETRPNSNKFDTLKIGDYKNKSYKNKKAKVTFEKKIIFVEDKSNQTDKKNEIFSIEMTFEGKLTDEGYFDPDDVSDDKLIQTAKITKIDRQ